MYYPTVMEMTPLIPGLNMPASVSCIALMRTSQALPKCTSGGLTLDQPLGRQNGGVPGVDAIDEKAVAEGALVALGDLLDGEGPELGVATVDVPEG